MKKILLIIGTALIPLYALADVAAVPKLGNPAPGTGSNMEDFVKLLLTIMQWVAVPMLTVSIIYAGFILVTARGNEAEITKGKTWITWTLVGAAIVLGAQVIASVIFQTAQNINV